MSQSKRIDKKIAVVIQALDYGVSVEDACRQAGMSVSSYQMWHRKHGNSGPAELSRIRSLEEENRQLRRMTADLSITIQLLQAMIRGRAHRVG